MAQPGKLNKAMWEKEQSPPAAGGKTYAAGTSGKAAMFEQAAKDAGPHDVVKKKTWASSGNSGGHSNMGKFKGKTQIGDGPPAKKGLGDLP